MLTNVGSGMGAIIWGLLETLLPRSPEVDHRVAEPSPFCPVLVPRNHTCGSCSKVSTWFSTWLFGKSILNETDEKCVQQPPDSTCHSGTTATGCSHSQERWFPKLSQDVARRRYSFSIDNANSNIWAPLQKVKEMEPIPQGVRRRQSPAQEQRDTESYGFRDQPHEHWKAARNQQCLFQPVSPLPEKDTSLEEDI